MRIAQVPDALDAAALGRLKKEFDRLLPGTPEQRAAFLEEAADAVSDYLGPLAVTADEAERRSYRLDRLAKTAKDFVGAVRALKDDDRDLIEIGLWIVSGKRGEVPDFAMISAAMDTAADVAERAAKAAAHYRRTTSGPPRGGTLPALVEAMARAYDSIFDERPSDAREGTFAKAVALALKEGGIKPRVGETKMRGILNELRRRGELRGAAPRPGAKQRARL